ncbi:glycosyltransferase family 4 protein [Fodinibius saliphilus]|uniref:glycosyltransferase family 4 protein n=1 Tax=Fodinibius saliphilus TaxID=1920650 RepID=UPI0011082D17|nr:glycosyltransferase family 4 protein [Fodinibius saliphilus]
MREKILLIGPIPTELGSNDSGGVAIVVWNLAKSLMRRNKNVSIAATGRYFKGYQKREGIEIYGIGISIRALFVTIWNLLANLPVFKRISIKQGIKLLYSIYFLSYIRKKVDYDIIHVHHVINEIPRAAKLLGIRTKIVATIHSYHSIIMEESKQKIDQEKLMINAQMDCIDHLTHVSKSVRRQGRDLGIKWSCKDDVIYNGIELDKLKNISRTKNENFICFVGSLINRKGIFELINSFSLLDKSSLDLKIIGDGEFKKEVENVKNSQIQYHGILRNKEVIDLIGKSRALVVPSKSESFGLVYLEALSVGTPVIGYAAVLKEFKEYLDLDNKLNDWLIEYDYKEHDCNELKEKIRTVIKVKDKTNYKHQKEVITNLVRNNLSWDVVSNEYVKLYKGLSSG